MAKFVPLFRGALGLNMRADPARLKQKDGFVELAEAVNVDITDSYRISRRPGRLSTAIASPSHSMFSALGTTLFVSGTELYRLDPGPTATQVKTGLTDGARLRAALVNNQIFFLNGYERGIFDLPSQSVQDWIAGTYYGPRTNRTFESPPSGHNLELYNGRIFIALDNILWFTEPFGYGWVDYSQNLIPLDSRITMVRGVTGGLYVSTLQATYFFSGAGPEDFQKRRVATYPVIEGTDVECDAEDLGASDMEVPVAGMTGIICTTTQGICFAGPEGYFRNLTKETIYYPLQTIGTAYIYRGKYVVCLE